MDSGKNLARTVDELGRIVLPSELRKLLGINERDQLDISVDGEKIIMQKSVPCCIVCDNSNDLKQFNNKPLCSKCHEKLTA